MHILLFRINIFVGLGFLVTIKIYSTSDSFHSIIKLSRCPLVNTEDIHIVQKIHTSKIK